MRTHEQIVRALTRTSQVVGFAVLQHENVSNHRSQRDALRIMRSDRLHKEPRRDATIALSFPDVLLTEIDIQSFAREDGSLDVGQVDVTITYHIPYPSYLSLNSAVVAARTVRAHLIDELARNPPPGWEDKDADQEELLGLLDSMFSVSCTVFEGGSEQQGVDIRLDHIWVFEQDLPTNEAEIEGECEAILEVVSNVWSVLLPDEHQDDPLAPLSFLFPEDE